MKTFNHLSLIGVYLIHSVVAHMEMSLPFPINSRFDSQANSALIDYNLKSPMDSSGSNYPCRGYQNQRPIRTTASYTAGQSYTMTIDGSATHGGGSCQLSLSYDNGATFKVIKSMIGGCPLTQSYPFTIPVYAPSGNALFAWTWFNEIGNREMYMNCAWVQINRPYKARRGNGPFGLLSHDKRYTSMESLPNIWRANIDGLSTCTTVEGADPVFANPGPDVVYGSGKGPSSPVTNPSGNCDGAVPAGRTYQGSSDTGSSSGSSSSSRSSQSNPVPTSSSTLSSSSTTQSRTSSSTTSSSGLPSSTSSSSSVRTPSSATTPSSSSTSSTSSYSPSSQTTSSSSSANRSSDRTTSQSSTTPTPSSSTRSGNSGGIFAPGAASSSSSSTSGSSSPLSRTSNTSSSSTSSSSSSNTSSSRSPSVTSTNTRSSSSTSATPTSSSSSRSSSAGSSTALSSNSTRSLTSSSADITSTIRFTNTITSTVQVVVVSNSSSTPVSSNPGSLASTTNSGARSSLSSTSGSSTMSTSVRSSSSASGTTPSQGSSNSVTSRASSASSSLTSSATPSTSSIITNPDPSPNQGSFSNLEFASPDNQTAYLPCVPGTLLCTSKTSFVICDQGPLTRSMTPSQVFKGPIQCAAGMQCVPFLQKFLSAELAAIFGGSGGAAPEGLYRSDRYLGL